MPINITQENHEQEIVKSNLPVILDIFATWCGPCQLMIPIFSELEQELKGKYVFAKINVDEARDLSIHYGVTSVPTFIFVKNNEVKGRETGYMSKDDLKAAIEQYLS